MKGLEYYVCPYLPACVGVTESSIKQTSRKSEIVRRSFRVRSATLLYID